MKIEVYEIQKLFDTEKVINEWVTENSVNGRKFTDIATGNCIFLPAAGCRSSGEGTFYVVGSYGYYWSSTHHQNHNDGVYGLYFGRSYAYWSKWDFKSGFVYLQEKIT